MGALESKQQLGERVTATKIKLDDQITSSKARAQKLRENSPKTIKLLLDTLQQSLEIHADIPENLLFVCWYCDSKLCSKLILAACENILKQPVDDDNYLWLKKNLLLSLIWCLKADNDDKFMYEKLNQIVTNYANQVSNELTNVFNQLKNDKHFNELTNIKDSTLIERQDDKRVGLLSMKNMDFDEKDNKENNEDKSFVNIYVCLMELINVSKQLNDEFLDYIGNLFNDIIVKSKNNSIEFRRAPMKIFDRCQAKVENEYENETHFPSCAKLLDIVRCSVTFDSIENLINGYKHLLNSLDDNNSQITLSRVKNGFNKDGKDIAAAGGYRDVKINVVFSSKKIKNVKIIGEIQFLLTPFLQGKKKSHKLYSILRQQIYYDMVTGQYVDPNEKNLVKIQGIDEVLTLDESIYGFKIGSVSEALGRLALTTSNGSSGGELRFYDLKTKKVVKTFDKFFFMDHIQYFNNEYDLAFTRKQMDKNSVFKMNRNYEISTLVQLGNNDRIAWFQIDQLQTKIVLLVGTKLQVRMMKSLDKIEFEIDLLDIGRSQRNPLAISNTGKFAAVTSGYENSTIRIVNLLDKKKYQLQSKTLGGTYSPSFFGENDKYLAIGGGHQSGKIEIWDVYQQKAIHLMNGHNTYVYSVCTQGSLLCACGFNGVLTVWDTSNDYQQVYQRKLGFTDCVTLSKNVEYLTVAGGAGHAHCYVYRVVKQ